MFRTQNYFCNNIIYICIKAWMRKNQKYPSKGNPPCKLVIFSINFKLSVWEKLNLLRSQKTYCIKISLYFVIFFLELLKKRKNYLNIFFFNLNSKYIFGILFASWKLLIYIRPFF